MVSWLQGFTDSKEQIFVPQTVRTLIKAPALRMKNCSVSSLGLSVVSQNLDMMLAGL